MRINKRENKAPILNVKMKKHQRDTTMFPQTLKLEFLDLPLTGASFRQQEPLGHPQPYL